MAYCFFKCCDIAQFVKANKNSVWTIGKPAVIIEITSGNEGHGNGGDADCRSDTYLYFADSIVRGGCDGSIFRQDFEPIGWDRSCGRRGAYDPVPDALRLAGIFGRAVDSFDDRLDSVSHGGVGSRGCQAVDGRRMLKRRKRCFILYIFIFPACGRNLSRQVAESQTIQK